MSPRDAGADARIHATGAPFMSSTASPGATPTSRAVNDIQAPPTKSTREPETVSQAMTWQVLNNGYVRAGLCYRCAAQAGYGHQHGWTQVRPPCESCAPVVATFPNDTTTAWRYLLRGEFPSRR